MKNILILFSLVGLASCSKDVGLQRVYYPDSIQAGQASGKGILCTDTLDMLDWGWPFLDKEKFLDLNKDGINDICFRLLGSSSITHHDFLYNVLPLNNGAIVIVHPDTLNADTLIRGDVIGSGMSWMSDTCLLAEDWAGMGSSGSNGLWLHQTDNYLGVRMKTGTNVLYGWVRIILGQGLIIEEYACTVGYKE